MSTQRDLLPQENNDAAATEASDARVTNTFRPWNILEYPPKYSKTLANLGGSTLHYVLSIRRNEHQQQQQQHHQEILLRDQDTAIIEHQLAEWWEQQVAEQLAAGVVVDRNSIIPWGGLVLHRLEDTVSEGTYELVAVGQMQNWARLVRRHAAILCYQLADVEELMTDSRGTELKVVIWGVVERVAIEKAAKAPGNSEVLGSYLRHSVVSLYPYQMHPNLKYVMYGRDKWIYPFVSCDPREYGPEEVAGAHELDTHHERYEYVFNRFVQLVSELGNIERKSPGSTAAAATETNRDRPVRDYLDAVDLSIPAVRVADLRMRRLLFFHAASLTDARERNVIANVGARIIQRIVEMGWPCEQHVIYYAMRTLRDDYRVSIRRLSEFLSKPQSTAATLSIADLSLTLLNGSSLDSSVRSPPFLMLPGDTMLEFESRFRSSMRRVQRELFPFRFDEQEPDELYNWSINIPLVISRRFTMLDRAVIAERVECGAWRVAMQPADVAVSRQVLFDPFPTRAYFFFVRPDGNNDEEQQQRLRRSAVAALKRLFDNIGSSGGQIWRRKNSVEADRWLETVHLAPTGEKHVVAVFPYVVFPSLTDLRNAMPADLATTGAYADGVSFFGLTFAASRMLSIQPPLNELRNALIQSSSSSSSTALPRDPSRQSPILESEHPFTSEELARGVNETLARMAAEGIVAEPTCVWIRTEASFVANPPEESADKRPLARVRGESSEVLARNGRHACEGYVITYQDWGYWLGSEFRVMVQLEHQLMMLEYKGDGARFLQHRHKLDPTRLELMRSSFSPQAAVARNTAPLRSSQQLIVIDRHEPAAAAAATPIPMNGLHRANSIKTVAAAAAAKDEPQALLQQRKLDANLARAKAHYRPLPGQTRQERETWKRYAGLHGEAFRDFLYNRSSSGSDPKSSISVKPVRHPDGEESFQWYSHVHRIGGFGFLSLSLLWLLECELPERVPAVSVLFQQRKDHERARLPEASAPPRWSDVAYTLLEERFLRQFLEDERHGQQKPLHFNSAKWIQWDRCREFHDASTKPGAAAAVVIPRPISSGDGDKDSSLEQSRQELEELYRWTTSIIGTVAAKYLRGRGRGQRGLNELSSDVLERSPAVRFHPSLIYHVKTVADAQTGRRSGPKRRSEPLPVLICFCFESGGGRRPVGCQRIFLNPKTAAKICFDDMGTVNKAKKSLGQLREENAFFFVQPGRLEHTHIVFLAEGPETAWSIAAASRYLCVYCSFGVGNFWRFRGHLEAGAGSGPSLCLVLDREKDEKRRATVEGQVTGQILQLRAAGWRVCAVQPDCDDGCKDFNEVHKRHGIAAVRDRLRLPESGRVTELPEHLAEESTEEWARYRK